MFGFASNQSFSMKFNNNFMIICSSTGDYSPTKKTCETPTVNIIVLNPMGDQIEFNSLIRSDKPAMNRYDVRVDEFLEIANAVSQL
jgi:hypothetical protein